MSNNFDLNNTFDPDQGKQPEKVTKEVPSKLPTVAKGVDHYLRRTDTDPKAAKRAERQVATMFALSAFFTLVFLVSFVAIPREKKIAVNFRKKSRKNHGLSAWIFLSHCDKLEMLNSLTPDVVILLMIENYYLSMKKMKILLLKMALKVMKIYPKMNI